MLKRLFLVSVVAGVIWLTFGGKGYAGVKYGLVELKGVVSGVRLEKAFKRSKIAFKTAILKGEDGRVYHVRLFPEWVGIELNFSKGDKVSVNGWIPPARAFGKEVVLVAYEVTNIETGKKLVLRRSDGKPVWLTLNNSYTFEGKVIEKKNVPGVRNKAVLWEALVISVNGKAELVRLYPVWWRKKLNVKKGDRVRVEVYRPYFWERMGIKDFIACYIENLTTGVSYNLRPKRCRRNG